MADITPSIEDTSSRDGLLEHTISVDATSERRARRKSNRLAQLKDFSEAEIVSIEESGEDAPRGFTNYEVVITSVR